MPMKLNHPLTAKFDEALQVASQLHRNQARKGTQIPYLSHLLAVSSLVLEYGGTETQAIAALLHDAVEDCGGEPVLENIREQFGKDVASIVASCTDSFEAGPKRSWRERKEAYLDHLREADPEHLLVTAADKFHNLRTIQRDLKEVGYSLWSRFNVGPSELEWYYRSVIEILNRRLDNAIVASLKVVFSSVRPKMLEHALDKKHEARLKAAARKLKQDPE